MRLRSLAIIVSLLPHVAPCIVTTSERLRQLPPAFEASSSRSLPEISGCLLTFAEKRGWPIAYMPRPGGATITSFDMAPLLIVDIEDGSPAHRVTARWQPAQGSSGGAKLRESISACL